MAVVEVHGVGVAYAAPVFSGVTFRLARGFTGLVGANGAGKTTLLRILAGETSPHEGSVRLTPPGARVALCAQGVDAVPSAAPRVGAELRGRLALADLARWPTLSPGERKRWQIAAALASEPDVLLLDEPTNHLDGAARALLVAALARYGGVAVLVSHARALLDALPRATLRAHAGCVRLYPGGYTRAAALWREERAKALDAHDRAVLRARVAAQRLADARRARAAADAARGGRQAAATPRDHDARSMGKKTAAAWAEERAGRLTATRRAELERAERDVPEVARDVTLGREVFARWSRAPSPVLFHVDRAFVPPVLHDVCVTIGREERVRVEGANGAGKSTLLAALVAVRREGVLHLPQELDAEAVSALARRVRSLDPGARGRVLAVFAALGSDPGRVAGRADDALSPGEARKLALACGLGERVWALVLDEPTNHLDLPSIERLEAALRAYPGCVVLVTHDDRFAAAITTRSLHVERGRVR